MRAHPPKHPRMRYRAFIRKVARAAEVSFEDTTRVIAAMVPALQALKFDETVRTPLGTFWLGIRNTRKYTPPNSTVPVDVPAMMMVKFRANAKLRKKVPS